MVVTGLDAEHFALSAPGGRLPWHSPLTHLSSFVQSSPSLQEAPGCEQGFFFFGGRGLPPLPRHAGSVPCQPGCKMPMPGSESINRPSSLTVIEPTTIHSPISWSKLQRAVFSPGPRSLPVTGFGRLGKRTGTGRSKFSEPEVCTVITSGKFSPGGKGPGRRSGGTGAMPTLPPRVPLALKSEFAGTVSVTPASAGLFDETEDGKVMTVSFVMLT